MYSFRHVLLCSIDLLSQVTMLVILGFMILFVIKKNSTISPLFLFWCYESS